MNKTQTNQFSMGAAVLGGLDKHSSIWAANVKAAAKRDELEARISEIEDADERQLVSGSGGERKGKIEAKRKLADVADIVASGVCGHATEEHEHTTFMEFDKRKAAIFAMKDVDCLAFCRQLQEYAGLHAVALADYNVSTTLLGELDGALDAFRKIHTAPTQAKAKYGTATNHAKEGLKAMFVTLKWWDKFMGTLRKTEHDFYTSYGSWRKVHKTGIRHVAIRGTVVAEGLLTPLYRVKVTVAEATDASYTGKAGKFRMFSLGPGVYTLRFELKGCEPVTVTNVCVVKGKITEVEVRLVKG